MFRAVMWLVVASAAGCNLTGPGPTPTPAASLWGEIITVGQAEQADAPALLADESRIRFAWIGADDSGVHQDARVLTDKGLSERVVLPLPPVHPYQQRLVPAGLDGMHMLWLDAESASPDGGSRLFTAYVNATMEVERGPIRASDRLTLRYAIVANGDGSLWVVWSGGPQSEPSLYAQYVDPLSRPRPAQRLVSDADWPALARANDGTAYVFWMGVATRQVFRAVLGDGVLQDEQVSLSAPVLDYGDRVVNMSAALDSSQGYLFWNVARASGQMETWYTSGALERGTWSAARRLGVDWTTKALFETGYNSGAVFAARAGDRWLRWAAPAEGQYGVLALAAQMGDELAVVYLRAGEVVGYQAIALISGDLIGLPALATNRTRHLYLAWSQPSADGYADLEFSATQRVVSPP